MTWVKIDDQMVDNRKIDRLTDRAFRLYMAGLCFCGAQLTDGILLAKDVKVVCAKVRATRKHVDELFEGELWVPTGGGGFQVKDFLIYNPPAHKVKERREELSRKRSEAGRRGAEARWHGKPDGKTDGKRDGIHAMSQSMAPYPSRKDQKPLQAELALVMNQAREAAGDT